MEICLQYIVNTVLEYIYIVMFHHWLDIVTYCGNYLSLVLGDYNSMTEYQVFQLIQLTVAILLSATRYKTFYNHNYWMLPSKCSSSQGGKAIETLSWHTQTLRLTWHLILSPEYEWFCWHLDLSFSNISRLRFPLVHEKNQNLKHSGSFYWSSGRKDVK